MKKYLLLYNFAITLILGVSAFTSARSREEYILAVLFIPLPLYFGNRLFKMAVINAKKLRYRPKMQFAAASAGSDAEIQVVNTGNAIEGEVVGNSNPIKDVDRRLFLRLIAGSGVSLFLLSIFTKDAHAAFFGSVPGPGTVSVKNIAGDTIDPAEKQPTDGYEIAQLDDTHADFSYYGFLDKAGRWYIMRETILDPALVDPTEPGTYRYAAGLTAFDTNWGNRTTLTYTTFDAAF